jgi:hypothetical protein
VSVGGTANADVPSVRVNTSLKGVAIAAGVSHGDHGASPHLDLLMHSRSTLPPFVAKSAKKFRKD